MKKILFRINALAFAAAMVVAGFAVHRAHAEPDIDIWASKSTVTVNPGENFSLSVQFSCEYYNAESAFTLSVSPGGTELIKGGGGSATPGKMYDFMFCAPNGSPKINYISFTVNYAVVEYISEEEKNVVTGSKTYTVQVEVAYKDSEPIPPVLENVGFDKDVVEKGEAFSVFADVINDGPGGISDAVLTVRDAGGKQLARKYIGGVEENSSVKNAEIKIPGLNAEGTQTITVYLDYVNSKKRASSTNKSAGITVKAVVESNGKLKIQNVTPPIKAGIDSYSKVFFTVTNPTADAVKGAEAFLYDDNDNVVSSLYVNLVEANSSMPLELEFPVTGKPGSRVYRLTVTDNRELTITSSFSFSAVSEEELDEQEKPANLKIQAVNAPSKIYAGVKTAVPFTLVNAGKGSAYNVEIYVNDANGVEIARKYIGLIPASGTYEGEFKLKFDENDVYNLTFYAVCESASGAIQRVSEAFEQRVVAYRASIEDVTGYEWIYNGMGTIEFAVLNAGTDIMYNVNAELADTNGNVFGKTYVGTIAAGEKKERVRFRNVFIDSMGGDTMPLVINVTYENADMQEFPLSYSMTGTFYNDNMGGMVTEPYYGDPVIMEGEEPKKGLPLIFIIAGGAVVLAGVVVVIVVVTKKKKKRSDDDDIDYFLSQLKLSAPPASPLPAAEPSYPSGSDETEFKG